MNENNKTRRKSNRQIRRENMQKRSDVGAVFVVAVFVVVVVYKVVEFIIGLF